MATLGSLVVSLRAETATLASDLGKANQMFENAMRKIGKVSAAAQDAVEGLVAAFTVQRIGEFAKGLIEAAAHLDNLHTQTGLSVNALSALSNEAHIVGLDVDTAANSFDKLQKLAFSAAGGNKAAAAAFAAIGISAKQAADGLKHPDQLLQLVAKSLNGFADDGNKAALMMILFGKGGAQMAELLKQIADNGYTASTTTKEQAKAAEDFSRAMAALTNQLKATATTVVMDLLPAFDKVKVWLEWVAIFGGTAFLWLYALPKGAAIAVGALAGLDKAFVALNVSLGTFSTLSLAAGAAFKVLGAFIIGFELGRWAYEQFAIVRTFGAGMISLFAGMWIEIKYDTQIALAWMSDKLHSMTAGIGNLLSNASSGIARAFGHDLVSAGKAPSEYGNMDKLVAERAAARKQNQDLYSASRNYNAFLGLENVVATPHDKLGGKPSIKSFDPNAKIPKLASDHDELLKTMDARLKVINDAIKAEDAAYQVGNKQLDADYGNGLSTLADYTTQKANLLEDSFRTTQRLYDAEIALAQYYVTQITAKLAKDTNLKVDPSQQNQKLAKIAADQAELAQAASKMQGLSDAKALAGIKHPGDELEVTKANAAASSELAKNIWDLDIAYAQMTGDTAAANEMQTRMADAVLKQKMSIEGLTDSTRKLLAIEEDRRLRSSQSGLDGMKRSIIDYGKSLADVAKQTEAMTTKMLTGMEDALVSFVMTGKLNFKSLINSMIEDLARMVIREQVMGGISKWIGVAMGLTGAGVGAAAAGGSTFVAGAGGSTFMASGGPVYKGQVLTVGERGPETFVPSMAGSIVPNGAGASGGIVYSPTIQIDSRSDRAAVMNDTVKAVRQGQADLLALLRRYNPGLKI